MQLGERFLFLEDFQGFHRCDWPDLTVVPAWGSRELGSVVQHA